MWYHAAGVTVTVWHDSDVREAVREEVGYRDDPASQKTLIFVSIN